MNKNTNVKESATTGAVSAHSIAVRPDVGGNNIHRRAGSFLDFLSDKSRKGKKYANSLDMKPVTPFKMTISENVSLDQMFSKLSGLENGARKDDDNSTTYGVEDDSGNMMKITVRGDQAQEFEVALAQELAEVEHYKMTGNGGQGRDVSMAEVLFNLKQKFDIVDVEFPEIPKDKIYNADKMSEPEDGPVDDDFSTDLDDDLGDETSDLGGDEELDNEGEGEDFDFDDDLESDGELEDEDEDVGEEFTADENEEESMLKQIIKMLSAEAEARKAQYEAEAEKSRELQAEYAAKAAEKEMYKQEELLQMEEEKKRQQEKEKEAKKLADLARYRARGVTEDLSFKNALIMLNELGELEDETTIRMQRRNLKDLDDPREKQLHTQMLNLKRRLARTRSQKQNQEDREEKMQQDRENQTNQQQNQNNNNPMQPVPDRRPIGGSNV